MNHLLWNKAVTADEILQTGVLNQWYLVCRSEDVHDKPVALTRLGRKIVVWRDDATRKVHALNDFCPHRGAPLSFGAVVDGGIACRYHGLVVDGRGVVQMVPPVRDCNLIGKETNIGYPAEEHAGAIWLYFSDGIDKEVPPLELPEALVSADWSGFLFIQEWNCNYRAPMDNRLDPMHGVYLHADSFTLSLGKKQSELQLTRTEQGFVIERDNQRGVNIDRTEVEYKKGNNFWVCTEIPYPKSVGGNFFRILGYPTPIDANRTYVWFFRYQKSAGWRRDMWRFLYKNRLDRRHADVVEQDRVMIEAIPEDARFYEHLIQSDVGVGAIRRMQRKEAEEQASRINAQFGFDAGKH
jgi:phenylpropionate dioxygenase-like ring-hydroxylating dioxygenase large terminal subunit